jgi:hypothetical protein
VVRILSLIILSVLLSDRIGVAGPSMLPLPDASCPLFGSAYILTVPPSLKTGMYGASGDETEDVAIGGLEDSVSARVFQSQSCRGPWRGGCAEGDVSVFSVME